MKAAYATLATSCAFRVLELVVKCTVWLAATGTLVLGDMVSAGKALTGSAGLLAGQETMKALASVYTSLRSSGVSKGAGNGRSPVCSRRYAAWRASMVRIDPAAVRYCFERMSCAAPR